MRNSRDMTSPILFTGVETVLVSPTNGGGEEYEHIAERTPPGNVPTRNDFWFWNDNNNHDDIALDTTHASEERVVVRLEHWEQGTLAKTSPNPSFWSEEDDDDDDWHLFDDDHYFQHVDSTGSSVENRDPDHQSKSSAIAYHPGDCMRALGVSARSSAAELGGLTLEEANAWLNMSSTTTSVAKRTSLENGRTNPSSRALNPSNRSSFHGGDDAIALTPPSRRTEEVNEAEGAADEPRGRRRIRSCGRSKRRSRNHSPPNVSSRHQAPQDDQTTPSPRRSPLTLPLFCAWRGFGSIRADLSFTEGEIVTENDDYVKTHETSATPPHVHNNNSSAAIKNNQELAAAKTRTTTESSSSWWCSPQRSRRQESLNWECFDLAQTKKKQQKQRRSLDIFNCISMANTKWRTAVDPNSGKEYYYHVETRETQWRKPMELATPEEREEMERKERQQKEFFAAMEANILKSISQGAFSSPSSPTPLDSSSKQVGDEKGGKTPDVKSPDSAVEIPPLPRPNLVRTISTMEDKVLVDLIQRVPSHRHLMAAASGSLNYSNSDDDDDGKDKRKDGEKEDKEIVFKPPPKAAETPAPVRPVRSLSRRAGSITSLLLGSIDEKSQISRDLLEQGLMERGVDAAIRPESGNHTGDDKNNNATDDAAVGEGSFWLRSDSGSGDEADIKQGDLDRQMSFGTMLAGLPKEGQESARSLYGTSNLDESKYNIEMGMDEFLALGELAKVTDQMAQLKEEETPMPMDENGAMPRSSLFLTDIAESDDGEEEDESSSSPAEDTLKINPGLLGTAGAAAPAVPSVTPTDTSTTVATSSASDAASTPASTAPPTSLISGGSDDEELLQKPPMTRRNTCGTLYVSSTMASPDNDAMIKCVCGVYRAHIVQSEQVEGGDELGDSKYRLFNDMDTHQKEPGFQPKVDFVVKPPAPTLEEITIFYLDVFRRAQMEADCIIMSLIYVERLMKTTQGALRPRSTNWRSILFSCMVLSSKVCDDLSMWNADFSRTCPAGVKFPLPRINELEVAVLSALTYKVKVPASEYAKYYFLLRSMLIKSGLSSEDLDTASPLDVEGARRLQHVSGLYQSSAVSLAKGEVPRMPAITRSKSVGAKGSTSRPLKGKVGLEHVVQM